MMTTEMKRPWIRTAWAMSATMLMTAATACSSAPLDPSAEGSEAAGDLAEAEGVDEEVAEAADGEADAVEDGNQLAWPILYYVVAGVVAGGTIYFYAKNRTDCINLKSKIRKKCGAAVANKLGTCQSFSDPNAAKPSQLSTVLTSCKIR